MILYLDTSSIVKLYAAEAHSAGVRGWVEEAEIVATCRVAYPEMLSALTRRLRTGDLAKQDHADLVRTFAGDWEHYAVIDFDELEAGRLAAAHGLRGFDAVHLSAAKLLARSVEAPSVAFSSFDEQLNKAAGTEGFTVLTPK